MIFINFIIFQNTDTDQNNNPESSTTIGVKLRKKNRNNSNRDKLDSVRYSMYTLQSIVSLNNYNE